MIDEMKVGEYYLIKNGKEWLVCLGQGDNYITKSQDAAEIISRLIRIENLLKRRNKK